MAQVDTVDKIVQSYFAPLTAQPFTYKEERYVPRPLRVSPGLLRGYTCPASCGGCCSRFSLEYLPTEDQPYGLTERIVEFDGREIKLFNDPQTDHDDRFCRNLDQSNGRCKIHGKHPFSCDFELIRFAIQTSHSRANLVTTRLYGRGWQMMRIDGERGAKCEITPITEETIADVVRKLLRLKEWTDHFGLETYLPTVIAWAKAGPHDQPLALFPSQYTPLYEQKIFPC